MEWLFKPKVQLGLFINFIFVMFTLISSMTDRLAYDYRSSHGYVPPSASKPLPFLPQPTGPSKATSFVDNYSGDFNVYLDNDLSLISRPDLVLRLSPLCTVRGDTGTPRSVLLRFTAYSGRQNFTYNGKLVITADGVQVWPAYSRDGGELWQGWDDEPVPRSTTLNDNGSVNEIVGKEIPYAVFLKTVTAKRVNFRLGPEATDLTDEQLGALRDMNRTLSQPHEETRKRF